MCVVVPVRDGAEALDRCLAALDGQDYPPELLSVVVVDNASVEDVAAVVARHPRATLLRQPSGGSYAARNLALRGARAEVLAFTDADCDPLPDWVSASVGSLTAEPRAAMVGGAVQLTYEHGRPVSACELFEAVQGFPQERYLERYRFAVTANMTAWRATFDEVGPFGEELVSGGDHEWGNRVAAAGGLQRYAPAAVVRHPARATWDEALRKWRRVSSGRVATHRSSGGRRRDAARVVWREGKSVLLEVGRSLRYPQLPTPAARVRYLAAHTAYRTITAAAFTRELAASLGRRRG